MTSRTPTIQNLGSLSNQGGEIVKRKDLTKMDKSNKRATRSVE